MLLVTILANETVLNFANAINVSFALSELVSKTSSLSTIYQIPRDNFEALIIIML